MGETDLHALDQLAWAISLISRAASDSGYVEIPLKNEKTLTGRLHGGWNVGSLRCLINTMDLKDAYKQFGMHEDDRCKAVVSLKNVDGDGTLHYLMNCMPFGVSSSVHNFNRIGRMLWALGVVELKLLG